MHVNFHSKGNTNETGSKLGHMQSQIEDTIKHNDTKELQDTKMDETVQSTHNFISRAIET